MPLFQLGSFKLHSGEHSSWKIDCDSLTMTDWHCLAHLVAGKVGYHFSVVEGVPRGGLALAEALECYRTADGPLLLVDDVLTTGQSLEAHRAGRDAVGIVVFARRLVTLPWVTALFTMSE